MERRAGFEPATSRVADEVTAIFTTGRGWSWRGTIDAVAALIGRSFHRRSNRHLHHRLPRRFAASRHWKEYAGEQAISVSVTSTQTTLSEHLRCGAWQPLVRAPPQCVSQRRESNPLFQGTKYPVSSPPASVEPRSTMRGKPKNCLRRLPRRVHANSERVRSAIGVRLIASFPPAGPARLGTRVAARAPGSGSPVPASSRQSNSASVHCLRATKNPPEHLAREGSHRKANCRSRLRRDRSRSNGPGTRYRSA